MLAAHRVKLFNQVERAQLPAVDRHRRSLLKPDGHAARLIGRFFRRMADLPDIVRYGVGGVLQFAALMTDVPDVAVTAVDLLDRLLNRYIVFTGVFDSIFARLDFPLPPRRDDLELRRQRQHGELEANLIVALAGASVCHGVRALAQSNFDLAFGEQWACNGRAKEILAFIYCAGSHHLEEVVARELLAHVLHVALGGAGLDRFLDDAVEFALTLDDVAGHGDDFTIVMFLKPRNDDGGIQASGVCEDHFHEAPFLN